MISIVLPIYNGEKYVRASIESILKQTYRDFELIIVDDCSTDCTLQIVREFEQKDTRIQVICNVENLKLPKSLNVGFSHCKGDYYTWTSDDNIYEVNAIEILVSKIEEGYDVVWADFAIIDEKGKRLKKTRVSGYPPKDLLFHDIVGACFLYRKEVQEVLEGYTEDEFLVEDYDFWLRAYLKGFRFACVEQILYRYRLHSKSLTGTSVKKIQIKTIQLIMKNLLRNIDRKTKSRICCEIVITAECIGGRGCFYRLLYLPLAYFFSPSTAKAHLGFLEKRG
ncbi:MAG: glycosyltransferase [Lachnospiraceae bacterium]